MINRHVPEDNRIGETGYLFVVSQVNIIVLGPFSLCLVILGNLYYLERLDLIRPP